MADFFGKPVLRKALHLLSGKHRSWLKFIYSHRYLPHTRTPRTYSEHLHRRKIYDHDPRYALFADKVAVKEIVTQRCGPGIATPNLFVGETLPPRDQRNWLVPFVIKSNNGCKTNYFVRAETDKDWDRIESEMAGWDQTAHFDYSCEYWYREIPSKILVEPIIGEPGAILIDYRFYVFAGEVAQIWVVSDKLTPRHRVDFFNAAWEPVPFNYAYPKSAVPPPRPKHLHEMLRIAATLGKDIDFVRIDLYDLPSGPAFGEMTFAPYGGFLKISPPSVDYTLGQTWQRAKDRLRACTP